MVGRIPVIDVMPQVHNGRLPAKATVGEPFPVSATVFREGHDLLGAEVVLTDPDGARRPPIRLHPQPAVDRHSVDRYRAWVTPDRPGAWVFEIHAWSDPIATWQHDAGIKIRAGVDVELMFTEGRILFERVLTGIAKPKAAEKRILQGAIEAAQDTARPVEARLAQLESPELTAVLLTHPLREMVTVDGPYAAYADRPRALFSSWYEFFPRSEGAFRDSKSGAVVSGTFGTAAKRLEAVAAMGFDVVYLPPIHPIGEVNRKGPNNTLNPGPDDTGSPWAIGSKDGGHDAVHPDLGTLADFDAFMARASSLGLEVALDLALQCAPDHPWVKTHPEWFTTRADGTIAFAENPPKKYQDIYPLNFDNDPEGLAQEVLRVVRHWMAHGVRIFRVDNPHTKPVPFWQWLLAEIRATDPDVLFLSEAFTKPPMLQTLGAIGFHQSYTYFTWRTSKGEVEDYLREVATESDQRVRPNFFVNTPDILHEFLQYGGPAAFKIRAVLAAMGSPSWGVYSGYELFEHVAVRPGSEEYLDSEKYQVRIRDWEAAEAEGRSLAPYLTKLNELRNTHPALQLLRNLVVHRTDDDGIICFSKVSRNPTTGQVEDRVIVVINLDPHAARDTMVHLDLAALGLEPGTTFPVRDELTGDEWHWGADNYVRLDPHQEPAHVLTVRLVP
jgi:starch synthase (maltosyl-transferring)